MIRERAGLSVEFPVDVSGYVSALQPGQEPATGERFLCSLHSQPVLPEAGVPLTVQPIRLPRRCHLRTTSSLRPLKTIRGFCLGGSPRELQEAFGEAFGAHFTSGAMMPMAL